MKMHFAKINYENDRVKLNFNKKAFKSKASRPCHPASSVYHKFTHFLAEGRSKGVSKMEVGGLSHCMAG